MTKIIFQFNFNFGYFGTKNEKIQVLAAKRTAQESTIYLGLLEDK